MKKGIRLFKPFDNGIFVEGDFKTETDVLEYLKENMAQADEINNPVAFGRIFIDSHNNVYSVKKQNIEELIYTGSVLFDLIGKIADFVNTTNHNHLAFILWFYNTEDISEAVYTMYENCGWVQTDSSWATLQYRKTIQEGRTYLFREHRISNPAESIIDIYESVMDIYDYNKTEMQKYLNPYGYKVEALLAENDIPLILECIFEQEN